MRTRRWRRDLWLTAVLWGFCVSLVRAESVSPPVGKSAELRLERAAFDAAYVRDCQAFARRESCELSGDLNGDGKLDRAFKLRARKGRKVGIGVAWADGRFSVLGAGTRTPHIRTEVYLDGKDESASQEPLELDGIVTWRLMSPDGDGFADRPGKPGPRYAALSVVGKGIYYSGSDAAEMLYWDGKQWRWLILGF